MAPAPIPSWPRWLTWALAAELLLPAPVFFAMVPELPTLFAPLAGPWAARLFGHTSCGVDAFAPLAAWGLVAFGLLSLAAILRWRRPLAAAPAALIWWPAWLLAALVSTANAHM